MKIEKLILKQFASIYNAMNTEELTIDLSKNDNKICLLIGKNGSGKTSILSMLTPFAEVGTLDVRKDQLLIREGKEGYKEIHIRCGVDFYIIKHFYTPHEGKSHSVKSYIEKNGEEKNINGNVTSFKEYVKNELEIETEYLKLVRLGANVVSMLDLTETERKNFMSKILHEIDVYLDYYKNISGKLKQIKDIVSHTVNKMDKLKITSIEDEENEIRLKQSIREETNNSYMKNYKEITLLKSQIDTIENIDELKDSLKEKKKLLSKIESVLLRKSEIKHKPEFYQKEIESLEKEIQENTIKITLNKTEITSNISIANNYENQLRDILIQERKNKEYSKEIQRINERIIDLRKSINHSEELLVDFKPTISKKEYEEFVIILKNVQQLLNRTYEFGKKPITKVINLISEGTDVKNFINTQLLRIDELKGNDVSLFLTRIQRLYSFHCVVVENCKEDTCEAKKLYEELYKLLNSRSTDKVKDSEYYKEMELVYENLTQSFNLLENQKSTIKKLPENIRNELDFNEVFKNVMNLKMIYNDKDINDYLSLITEYELCLEKKKELNQTESQLSVFVHNDHSSFLEEQKENLIEDIENLKEKNNKLIKENSLLTESLKEKERTLDEYKDIFLSLTKHDEIKDEKEELEKNISNWEESVNKLKSCKEKEIKYKSSLELLDKEIQERIISLEEYKHLLKDMKKFNKMIDEMSLIKDSLSSKTGIPLHFIKNYLGNVVETTNELLETIYHGDLYLDQFEITPSSFSIPFYNKGIRIPDVKYASQGELSFISIALSFALSSRSMGKYNIRLLDEIDGPLDVHNREYFIKMIETQSEMIEAEQCFLITHNQMFSGYPVDIIDLSFQHKSDEFPLASFVDVIRK